MGRPSSGWEQLKLPSEQGTCPLSPHRSAASIFEVRCCLAQRCQDRSIAYVAAEMGISYATTSKVGQPAIEATAEPGSGAPANGGTPVPSRPHHPQR